MQFAGFVVGENGGDPTDPRACDDSILDGTGVSYFGAQQLVRMAKGEGFREKQAALEAAGLWRLIESTEPIVAMPTGEPEVLTPVFVYEAL